MVNDSSNNTVVVNEGNRGRDPNIAEGKKVRSQSKSRDLSTLEAKVAKQELATADVLERLDRLEQKVEELDLEEFRETMLTTLSSSKSASDEGNNDFQTRMFEMMSHMQAQMEELRKGLDENREDWAICKRAISNGAMTTHGNATTTKVQTPKPKEFSGKRDAKEVENFLWHMERYFDVLDLSEKMKVSQASLYFTDLAAIWWRRKYAEIEKGTCVIDTWADLKAEVKKQFYPENVAHDSRKKLKELKHTRTIREYVEEFSGLMLQIPNMSDDDLLFNFMDGLQHWASQELRRRNVQDISTALTVAETLMEYSKSESSKLKSSKFNHSKGGGEKGNPSSSSTN